MTEQRERVERALRGCAESGVPDTLDLWPGISERVTGRRTSEVRASEMPADNGVRQRSWPPKLVPNTRFGWILATLSVVILGVGIYTAYGLVGELFRQGLPGTVEPGSDNDASRNLNTQLDDNLAALRTEVDQTQSADGAKLTLDWAYADEKFVAVGLHTQRHDGRRRSGQPDSAVLEPSLWDDTVGNEAELPPYVKITDASGQDFDTVGGGSLLGPHRTGADATFEAPEGLGAGREHRFRLEVPLREGPALSGKPEAGPFVFDFEVPVRRAPTIEVGQRVEAGGVTLTLERVVDSPVLPQAVVCFEPPDDEHSWTPWLEDDGTYPKVTSAPQKLEGGCWSLAMDYAVEGRSSVTVANLEGFPTGPALADETGDGTIDPKTIRGPWTFEFDVPEAPGS